MINFEIVKLRQRSELAKSGALWFHQKWGISIEAYVESIEICLNKFEKVPQWYVVLDKDNIIIGGAGIIENDFHQRKDLAPNLCALFIEENFRGYGIARQLINFIKEDLISLAINKIYLTTEHENLYEKMGWSYLVNTLDDDNNNVRIYELKI